MNAGSRDMLLGATGLITGAILLNEVGAMEANKNPLFDYGVGPVLFPKALLVIWLSLSFLILVRAWFFVNEEAEQVNHKRLWSVVAGVSIFVAVIPVLGFLVSAIIFSLLLPCVVGYRNLKVVAAVGAIFPLVVWYAFTHWLDIFLPSSMFSVGF
tara:strand:+ start:220 stop:684 length:465 start_codon:yes stop_codon:yes gene_type:complete